MKIAIDVVATCTLPPTDRSGSSIRQDAELAIAQVLGTFGTNISVHVDLRIED